MGVMVETDAYSGPAEVLLRLVTEKEMEIWDLSLKEIIDGYMSELEKQATVNLDDATELLMIVAILIQIKSRSLLPNEKEDEMEDLPDGAFDLLIARMLECKTFKSVSGAFEEMAKNANRSIPRRYGLDGRFLELLPDLLANITVADIKNSYLRATTARAAPVFNLNHLSPITRTVPETMDKLIEDLQKLGSATFKEITSEEDRIGIVFCFLAILELFKGGEIDILQAETFGEIKIEWLKDD